MTVPPAPCPVEEAAPAAAPAPAPALPTLVFITGPSGAGRSTAIRALEDIGHEVIDNLPLSLLPRLIDPPPQGPPLALGLDVRNRDFSTDGLIAAIDLIGTREDMRLHVVYLDCAEDELVRRYAETRRRHPLAPDGPPAAGIARERELLIPIRARADILIDTTGLTPHDLRAEVQGHFRADGGGLSISVQSFSYKRGLPRGLDFVFDCRFLRNPHWDPALRLRDGRDPEVAAHVTGDPRFAGFFARVRDLIMSLLPAMREEGKSHLAIGFGCTGGQHRSVTLAEMLAAALAEEGGAVSTRHRELERQAGAMPAMPPRAGDAGTGRGQ